MDIDVLNPPEQQEGTGLYRTVIVVEVLSDKPMTDFTLEEMAREIDTGDSSGRWEVLDAREVGRRDAYRLLAEQHSDPEFLLGDDAWKYGLHNGDEVTWNDPDDGACTRTLTIQSITYLGDNTVRITDKAGGELECLLSELS